MNVNRLFLVLFGVFWLFGGYGCVGGDDFDSEVPCNPPDVELTDAAGFYRNLPEGVVKVTSYMALRLFVNSSDEEGNIYGAIYLQDHPSDPTLGVELRTDLRDAYLLYPPGTEVLLELKGLYVRRYKGGIQVGSRLDSFGNITLGRIPGQVTKEYLRLSCEPIKEIIAKSVTAETLDGNYSYIYVRFNDVQLVADELCKSFAEPQSSTIRTLNTCERKKLELLNSGYAVFSDRILPSGTGHVQGILRYRGSVPQLLLNSVEELQLSDSRCDGLEFDCSLYQGQIPHEEEDSIPPGQGSVLISELADPLNTSTESNSRFIELYNASSAPADLSGWELRRYTNGNPEYTAGTVITFENVIISGASTLVIAANASHFEQVYGFTPGMNGGTSTAADSNGDDNIVLVNALGEVVDVFGVPGEDGTGTPRDFRDGRALRSKDALQGRAVFDGSQWEVYQGYNSGEGNYQPRNAPDDFDPGSHQGT